MRSASGCDLEPPQRFPRRGLDRPPRRPFPSCCSRGRVFPTRYVECRPPPLMRIPSQLEIVALAGHAALDHADARPGIEQCMDRLEGWRKGPFEPSGREGDEHQASAMRVTTHPTKQRE